MFFSGKRWKESKEQTTRARIREIEERARHEESLELEKGDIPAMIIAALMVFIPFLIFFCGALLLLWWFVVG